MNPKRRLFALGRMKQGRMNKTEEAYAAHLSLMQAAGEVLWYSFEPMKFRLADKTFYTPDFAVLGGSGILEMHEVKGSGFVVQDDARVKIKVCAEMYPLRFFMVFPAGGGGWKKDEV